MKNQNYVIFMDDQTCVERFKNLSQKEKVFPNVIKLKLSNTFYDIKMLNILLFEINVRVMLIVRM